ncbi:iron uptake system protein EfeO [Rothia sp. P5764]|uniref:iron uptake system protein EfeO n=1 Tax=unclassified Rothia (in: high G+C Gram-positive bacteria) TaxID=2689056 RepID=UPI003AC17E9F
MNKNLKLSALALSVGLFALTGCTENAKSDDSTEAVKVSSTETECKLSSTEVKAGKNTFSVTNDGKEVTEFYILADDGLRIISEIENIGPGITRDLTVELAEGQYKTSCKPGMVGDGIMGDLKVTANPDASPVAADEQALRDTAVNQYTAYVKDQTEQLKTKTDQFVEALQSGDKDSARSLYPQARIHYERIEPVAESFGDLDPLLDAREADLEDGQEWTGWHLLEKDLWQPTPEENGGKPYTPLTDDELKKAALELQENTQKLYDQTRDLDLTVDQIANGAKSLLDEVVFSKITGEEEIWSHTDLSDFQGNIDGARVAFEDVRPLLEAKNSELGTTLEAKFDDVQKLLDQYKQGDEFTPYTDLSQEQIRQLSDAIDALSEPLSQLTGAII